LVITVVKLFFERLFVVCPGSRYIPGQAGSVKSAFDGRQPSLKKKTAVSVRPAKQIGAVIKNASLRSLSSYPFKLTNFLTFFLNLIPVCHRGNGITTGVCNTMVQLDCPVIFSGKRVGSLRSKSKVPLKQILPTLPA
jgi:hypothetical protein